MRGGGRVGGGMGHYTLYAYGLSLTKAIITLVWVTIWTICYAFSMMSNVILYNDVIQVRQMKRTMDDIYVPKSGRGLMGDTFWCPSPRREAGSSPPSV